MDKLIEKIIEKTELKNWTLFLFIFAICYIFWLHSIEGKWFEIPKTEYHNTTLFLLEVFLSSLTITRILVAIKFLEAVNRTPIIADFINAVVVERKRVRIVYDAYIKDKTITGQMLGSDIEWFLGYENGINEREVWLLIYNNIIVEDEYPNYKICKEAVIGKTHDECWDEKLILGRCVFAPHPALHRGFDEIVYGKWWEKKVQNFKNGKQKLQRKALCLEHFILGATIFLIGSGAVKFLEWVIGHFL